MSATICPCNDLTEIQITEAIAAGANNLNAIFDYLRCPIYCGACLVDIDEILFAPP